MPGGQLLSLAGAKPGHFRLESGHHGEMWLELDQLFREPAALQPFTMVPAQKIAAHRVELVAGP